VINALLNEMAVPIDKAEKAVKI